MASPTVNRLQDLYDVAGSLGVGKVPLWDGSAFTLTALSAVIVPSCRVYNSANISIPNVTFQELTFDSERFDTDTMHSTSTQTERITITTAGLYLIGSNAQYAPNATGARRDILLRKNGATILGHVTSPPTGGGVVMVSIAVPSYFGASDYVEVFAYQDSGGALNVNASNGNECEAWAVRLSA